MDIGKSVLLVTAVALVSQGGCRSRCPQPSEAARPGHYSEAVVKLIAGVPHGAFAVAIVDGREPLWGKLLGGVLLTLDDDDRSALDRELRDFVSARLGLDLVKIKTAVVFAASQESPAIAALIGEVGGRLAGPTVATHHGTELFDIGEPLVAAKVGTTLIVGLAAGVEAAITTLAGKRPAMIGEQPELWRWIGKECGGAHLSIAGGGFAAMSNPKLNQLAEQLGVGKACLRVDGDRVRAVVEGNGERLGESVAMLSQLLAEQVNATASVKREVKATGTFTDGVSAIVAYHYLKGAVAQLAPSIKGDRAEIELAVAFGDGSMALPLIGIAAAVAIPSFIKYIRMSKTSEAVLMSKRIHDGIISRFLTPRGDLPALPLHVGPTPALGSCCASGGSCETDSTLWDEPGWVAVGFSILGPHNYSYEYVHDPASHEYRVRAYGDLDCDGVYSTFEIRQRIESLVSGPATEGWSERLE